MGKKKPKMGVGAWCLWLLCRSVSILPHWVQYRILSPMIALLMGGVVRYRRTLILDQLRKCFPEKGEAEIRKICRESYRTLAESIICTMTLAGMTEKRRRTIIKFNIDENVREAVKDSHFVLLASHYGFWEYAQYIETQFDDHYAVVAYHPLSNKAWEELFYYLRSFELVTPVSSNNYLRHFIQHRATGHDGKYMLLGMVSDQNAPPTGDVHWYDFLGRKTLFFDGGQQLALRFGLPVTYISMRRVGVGKYEGTLKLIYDGKSEVGKYEITEKYVSMLEQDIRRDPARWMWTHRRWKYTYNPETGGADYHRKG